jgi:hypothetical protein
MKASYEEGLANRFGLLRRAGIGNGSCLSVRGEGTAGQPWSSEIITFAGRSCSDMEKATTPAPPRARRRCLRRSLRT